MKSTILFLNISFLCILIISCSTQESKWQDAAKINSVLSYQEYLKEYPDGKYKSSANECISKLIWEKAKSDNSFIGYVTFLKLYPNTQTLIADSLLWLSVKKNDSDPAYKIYLNLLKQPIHKKEGLDALSKIVLFPYLGFLGNVSDMPQKEELKLSEDFVSKNSDMESDFHINGHASPLIYDGRTIELEKNAFNGKYINTVKYGKLKFIVDHGGIGKNGGFMMLIYLFGTRAQRDSITNTSI